MPDVQTIREHLFGVIMERVDRDADRRKEALTEYLLVTGMAADGAAEQVAELVPPVLPDLYAKWVNMFLDRLFETVPLEQIELIADGSEENNAAASLAYLMFLESERMEKQVAEDLAAHGLTGAGQQGTGENDEKKAAGALSEQFIRERMNSIAQDLHKERQAKAEAYKKNKTC
ncbi:hypothetical protein SAMN02745704_00571 [Paucidesulfovibrio gracilis DSM 16080]|uniref:Uncharacterized protein n=1 Tax=Paucidesulfovibrio gracilis DSM 16080 TaxID=1121449 RepID=A0A1T4WBC0_9BACT|nr:hypothetical protein [Paucidesulfovibrio gracilis]SKA74001.1 hypothetical protein SAMN02745704_00571 [Paucidesulfovibrio gracilis DSM 16080]